MLIAATQFTIVDINDPIQSGSEPANKVEGMLWLDTSIEPNALKRWDAEENKWVSVSDPDLEEKVSQIETSFSVTEGKIEGLIQSVSGATKEINTVKAKMTPEGIYSLVSTSDGYKEQVSGLTMTKDKFEQFVSDSDSIGKISSQANRINIVVKSDSSESSVELTDSAMKFISDNVKIDARKIDLSVNEYFNVAIGSKSNIYRQTSEPENAKAGDLWIDPDTGIIKQLTEANIPEGVLPTFYVDNTTGELLYEFSEEQETFDIYIDDEGDLVYEGVVYSLGIDKSGKLYIRAPWERVVDGQLIDDIDTLNSSKMSTTEFADLYMRFQNEEEKSGLEIGKRTSQSKLLLNNESVNIEVGGIPYSKFTANYVQFGNYQIRKSSKGALVFKLAQ